MIKRNINFYSHLISKQLKTENVFTSVYILKDGRILKIFSQEYIIMSKFVGYDIEKTILAAEQYQIHPNIKKPTICLYDNNNNFCGYISDYAHGLTWNQKDDLLTIKDRENLDNYAKLYSKLENIVKESPNIVFPDLLTCDNIIIDNQNNVSLIDFDGMQIGNNKVAIISSSLGNPDKIFNSSKYYNKTTGLFKKELDIKSLIHLYYLTTFNIDLNKIGTPIPNTNEKVTLEDIFQCLQLDDLDFMNKTWKVLKNNKTNEYLEDDVFNIADKYKMTAVRNPFNQKQYVKKLIRK